MRLTYFVLYIGAIFWAMTQLYPMIFLFMSSLKDNSSIILNVFSPPSNLQIQNYEIVWKGEYQNIIISRYLLNSTIVSVSSTIILIFTAMMAGYALARYNNKLLTTISNLFLGLVAVPIHSIVIPLFFLINSLGLVDTYLGLILPYVSFALPFSVLIAKAFFKSFQKEVEEAARVDGAGEISLLLKIVFPMSRPLLAVLAIINFPNFWNELMFAIIGITSNEMKTLPVGILAFRGRPEMEPRWDLMFSAMSISTIPLIIFYLLFQRQIIRGVTLGAVKG